MFNLTPTSLKERISKDYKERLFVVWLFSISVFSIILLIFLLPTFVYVYFEEKNTRTNADLIKNSVQFKKADDVVIAIKETNEQLKALVAAQDPQSPTDIIQKSIQSKNSFIHINEIEYKSVTATTSTLVLTGVADKRESLQDFVTKLKSVEGFSDVVLPVSNFAKDKNIDFSITIRQI